MTNATAIRERFLALSSHLDERSRRIFAATEARTAGHGGIAAVSRATGVAASTIGRGLAEASAADQLVPNRVRRPGGGDKPLVDKDPTLLADLLALVEPDARGDPMSPGRLLPVPGTIPLMYNRYSITKDQQAIRELYQVATDRTGNLPPMPGVFPDYAAPIVRNGPDGRTGGRRPSGSSVRRRGRTVARDEP